MGHAFVVFFSFSSLKQEVKRLTDTNGVCVPRIEELGIFSLLSHDTQRAKIVEKFHKPPLGVNVINFVLNGFYESIWVPRVPQSPKSYNLMIEVFKFIRYVERNKMHFPPILAFQ